MYHLILNPMVSSFGLAYNFVFNADFIHLLYQLYDGFCLFLFGQLVSDEGEIDCEAYIHVFILDDLLSQDHLECKTDISDWQILSKYCKIKRMNLHLLFLVVQILQ